MFSIFSTLKMGIRSQKEVIQEIHDTFYTEVDRLLAEAKIKSNISKEEEKIINKGERLKRLGFNRSNEAVLSSNKERSAKESEDVIEAITYFSNKYPFYKFITEKSVKSICDKYNLIYLEVDRYKGSVPDKNLLEIENFKINQVDECYGKRGYSGYIDYDEYLRLTDPDVSYLFQDRRPEKLPLEIAAPASDFELSGLSRYDAIKNKLEVPDPIVLQPVFFKGNKHYLIVTAWGLEASDELVVNHKNN